MLHAINKIFPVRYLAFIVCALGIQTASTLCTPRAAAAPG